MSHPYVVILVADARVDPGDLAQQQQLDVGAKNRWETLDDSPTGDELTDRVLQDFSERAGKKPDSVLPQVGKGLPNAVYERLAAAGVVNPTSPTRFPVNPAGSVARKPKRAPCPSPRATGQALRWPRA
ncbi:MAG: GPP34 family phosphoprotein [Ornithinimicrobium sp.]